MRELNLVLPEKSQIKVNIISFPDGQQDMRLDRMGEIKVGALTRTYEWVSNPMPPVLIKSRMKSFRDVELIMCAVSAIRNLGDGEIHLYSPYLLGARSDRDVTEGDGGTNYIRDVIAPVINLCNFKTVSVLDPHSDVTEACVKNLKKISNEVFISWVLEEIKSLGVLPENLIWIAPDAGASKKIYKLARDLEHNKVMIASKERDVMSGDIKSTGFDGDVLERDCLIIDDICDGGRTFIELAKLLKVRGAGKVYLAVTHGIFSNGCASLLPFIDGIYSTNSVTEGVAFVKQLNIF